MFRIFFDVADSSLEWTFTRIRCTHTPLPTTTTGTTTNPGSASLPLSLSFIPLPVDFTQLVCETSRALSTSSNDAGTAGVKDGLGADGDWDLV